MLGGGAQMAAVPQRRGWKRSGGDGSLTAAVVWDSILLGGTYLAIVQPLSDNSLTTCALFQRFQSSSILEALSSRTKLKHTLFPSNDILRNGRGGCRMIRQALWQCAHGPCPGAPSIEVAIRMTTVNRS